MDPVVPLVFVVLLALLIAGVPIGFALIGAGVIGLVLLDSVATALSTTGGSAFSAVANFSLLAIPLFVILGNFINHAGLGEQLYTVARRTVGRLPGGLAVASIFAGAGFGAVTGASVTGVATIGPLAVPEMRRYGYSDELSTGSVAAAGTLGILIPPSIAIVIYGITTGDSIGRLLMGGIVPGIVSAIVFSGLIIALVHFRRLGAPFGFRVQNPAPEALGSSTTRTAVAAVREPEPVWQPVLKISIVFGVVVGGIYSGMATVNEAAALAAFVGLGILVHASWRAGGTRRVTAAVAESLRDTVLTSAMLFLLFIGGSIFGSFLLISGVPRGLTEWITDLGVPPIAVVVLVLVGFLTLGTVLDGTSIILVAVPLAHPIVVTELGYDPIWFCILVIKLIEMGLMTPPVGLNAFVVAGVTKAPLERVFRGCIPFLIADVVTVAIIFAFPDLVTFLPNLLRATQ